MAIEVKNLNYKAQNTTPENPDVGSYKTYFKDDGKMYYLDSLGVEIAIGGNVTGLPDGGTTGQILSKIDNTDGNAEWTTQEAGNIAILDTATHFTSTDVEGALAELFTFVSDGKTLVAAAITDKGVTTAETDSFSTMATNIASISTASSWFTNFAPYFYASNIATTDI